MSVISFVDLSDFSVDKNYEKFVPEFCHLLFSVAVLGPVVNSLVKRRVAKVLMKRVRARVDPDTGVLFFFLLLGKAPSFIIRFGFGQIRRAFDSHCIIAHVNLISSLV